MHRVSLTCGLAVACLAAADAKFEIENGALKTPAVVFKTGSAVLQNADDAAVALAAAYLTEKTSVSTLRIEAHVQHGVKDAQTLTRQRALAVGRALIAKGVDCKRLIAVGFGDSKPASENAAENNRVLFVNAALRGHAIGGMPLDGGGEVAGDLCTSH